MGIMKLALLKNRNFKKIRIKARKEHFPPFQEEFIQNTLDFTYGIH